MAQTPSERLIDFLYILVRDHIPMGVAEDIMWTQVDSKESEYCNTYLEGYARDLATRLTDDTVDIMNWSVMRVLPDGQALITGTKDGEWLKVERGYKR